MRQPGTEEMGPIEGAVVQNKPPLPAVLAIAAGTSFLVLAALVALV